MRKTLIALLGFVALALWVMPAAAMPTPSGVVVDGPKMREPATPEMRGGFVGEMARAQHGATLSGTLIKQTAATTSWYLYPGACRERALGTWAPKSTPVSDSLNATSTFPVGAFYVDGQPDMDGGDNRIAYTRFDLSVSEVLFHIESSATAASQRPTIIDGTRMIWCGKFDANWVVKVGYPNVTYQLLYIDTRPSGTPHAGNWTLSFDGNISVELNYDYVHVIGGGDDGVTDAADPLGNSRVFLDGIINGDHGPHGDSELLVTYTGYLTGSSVAAGVGTVEGAGGGAAGGTIGGYSISGIGLEHRAIYIVMTSDCLFSQEDGLWPDGSGNSFDLISASDSGMLYSEQAPFVPPVGVSLFDASSPPGAGVCLVWTGNVIVQPADDIPIPLIAARVPPGAGELWQLAPGNENLTSDNCSLQKTASTDLFFEGGDPNTNLAINKQFNSVATCAFPVPDGTASLFLQATAYFDLPRFAGYVQDSEYRYYLDDPGTPAVDPSWSGWQDTDAGGGVTTGANQAWLLDFNELAAAVNADSVQMRFNLRCIPPFAADRQNCASSQANALLYDNFMLQVTTGVPAPLFGIFPGSVAQTTFVSDQTVGISPVCAAPCWPGNRSSDTGTYYGHTQSVTDNWNAPTGDSITISIVTGLRKNGMGVNWRRGFSKSVNFGEPSGPGFPGNVAYTNGSYNPAYDVPRMIYRLFDPATRTWSPFDSTELIANAVTIADPDGAGGAPAETTLIDSEFNMNWPPYDKVGTSLPPGFSINGQTAYSNLYFLPRGTKMQYYFKAVDINGGTSWQFTSDFAAFETEDLPNLPNSGPRAPDMIAWGVLPSAYPTVGSGLLGSAITTPVLNLEVIYSAWAFGYDPMTQALRGLGVRADRYRSLSSGTTAHDVGGHELPGQRPDRLSNFFPNYLEYGIVDSLAKWYNVVIQSNHTSTVTPFNNQDAIVVEQWWRKPTTGTDGGDRGFFLSGDDAFNTLLNTTGVNTDPQISLAQNVFGVGSAGNAWSGTNTDAKPLVTDLFTAANSGPGVGSGYSVRLDGDCPGPNKFDALVPQPGAGTSLDQVQSVSTYPSAQVAGVARMFEADNIPDKDRSKAVSYAFSIQLVHDADSLVYNPKNANWNRSGVENRMRMMYKFLTGIRGARTGAAGDTGKCWPCPTPTSGGKITMEVMQRDWNAVSDQAAFNTGTYGPLLPLQAKAIVTAVGDDQGAPAAAPRVNTIAGNFPNPFNPNTAIRFSSAQAGRATIRIFGVGGQLVRTLTTNVTPGANEVRWNGKRDNGSPLSSGVYFYKITFPDGKTTKAPNNLVLVK
jgi:hypothetical protein